MNRRRNNLLFIAATLALTGLTWSKASSQTEPRENKKTGKAIYEKLCAACHGPQGKGDGYKMLGPDPANLTSPTTTRKTDAELLRTIHKGKPNMPAWKIRLSEQEIEDVLAYIRSLRR